MTPNELGAFGEQLATELLVSKGMSLLGKNLVYKIGEIDLLLSHDKTLVVVEVKTLARITKIDPIMKINSAKQRKLRLLAHLVSAQYPDLNIRVDAVTVYWKPETAIPTITHYQNILTF